MSIFRSTDPTTFTAVDGIIVNESSPSPNVVGVAANIGIIVTQCERGPVGVLTEVGSIGQLHEIFGRNTYGLNISIRNKKFGRLRIIRAAAAAAVQASLAVVNGATTVLTFTAKQGPGVYGNLLSVTVAAGSLTGRKYTVSDTSPNAVLPTEVYDNVTVAGITATTFSGSNLVNVAVNSTASDPAVLAATLLAGGTDGVIADSDYQTAINVALVENSGNVIFLDAYNSARNAMLVAHVGTTQDKMCILAGLQNDTVAQAITDVANYRDVDGRVIYAYPWVQNSIGGVATYVNPAAFVASVFTQTAPQVDLAYVGNSQFMSGILNLARTLSRADFINLKNAGICSIEQDSDFGFKIKSGIVTQIVNSGLVMIHRRRMADYLTYSIGKFLKNYQNAVNSKANRALIKAAILAFVKTQEDAGILPKDSDVTGGVAKLVDPESLNTDATIAAGLCKILYRQRIFSSMRYLVLQADIGESVVVTAQ